MNIVLCPGTWVKLNFSAWLCEISRLFRAICGCSCADIWRARRDSTVPLVTVGRRQDNTVACVIHNAAINVSRSRAMRDIPYANEIRENHAGRALRRFLRNVMRGRNSSISIESHVEGGRVEENIACGSKQLTSWIEPSDLEYRG